MEKNLLDLFRAEIKGSMLTIHHCEGAVDSLINCLTKFTVSKQRSLLNSLHIQMMKIANGHRLSKETFAPEGILSSGNKYYAFKKIPIRGYCFYSKHSNKCIYVSHYLYKDYDKLKSSTTKKVESNFKLY